MTRSNQKIEIDDTPKHQKKAGKKPFGVEYFRRGSLNEWTGRRWYSTEKARDQAFEDVISKIGVMCVGVTTSDVRKIDRLPAKRKNKTQK
jgi:hypothetical protein